MPISLTPIELHPLLDFGDNLDQYQSITEDQCMDAGAMSSTENSIGNLAAFSALQPPLETASNSRSEYTEKDEDSHKFNAKFANSQLIIPNASRLIDREYNSCTQDDSICWEKDERATCDQSIDFCVDNLQALNTALCFLCSINMDSSEVERFLWVHPEALLLEGACLLPEDSAEYILEQNTRHCHCDGACNDNRRRVRDLVAIGYSYYHSYQGSKPMTKLQPVYFDELVEAEHTVRQLRKEELAIRDTLLETAVEVEAYRQELNREIQKTKMVAERSKRSGLRLLACNRYQETDSHKGNRINVLKYQVGTASCNFRSVKLEHNKLLAKIGECRRTQFKILISAFRNCRRYDICSVGCRASTPTTSVSTVSKN